MRPTSNTDIANANEFECDRGRERGRLEEFVNVIIDVLHTMGMINGECNVVKFIFSLEDDKMIVIMTLHRVTNAKATLTSRLLVDRWKKC